MNTKLNNEEIMLNRAHTISADDIDIAALAKRYAKHVVDDFVGCAVLKSWTWGTDKVEWLTDELQLDDIDMDRAVEGSESLIRESIDYWNDQCKEYEDYKEWGWSDEDCMKDFFEFHCDLESNDSCLRVFLKSGDEILYGYFECADGFVDDCYYIK